MIDFYTSFQLISERAGVADSNPSIGLQASNDMDTLHKSNKSVVDQTAISQKLEQNHGVFYCKVNCTARSMVTVALPSCCLCWVTCKFAKLIPIRTLFHYNPPIDWSSTIMLLPGIFKPTEQMCKLIFVLKTPHEKE